MGKGGVSVTVAVSALRGILGRVVTCAPRGLLGIDVRTHVTGKKHAKAWDDAAGTARASARQTGQATPARNAR